MGNAKQIPMPDGLERVIKAIENKALFTVQRLIEAGQNDPDIKAAILRAAEILKTVK
jgi:hypothetical protein